MASSYEPGNRAGSEFVFCSLHMGNFSPVDQDELVLQETKPKWWNIKLHRS